MSQGRRKEEDNPEIMQDLYPRTGVGQMRLVQRAGRSLKPTSTGNQPYTSSLNIKSLASGRYRPQYALHSVFHCFLTPEASVAERAEERTSRMVSGYLVSSTSYINSHGVNQ